jgi:chromosome segregation ATPase
MEVQLEVLGKALAVRAAREDSLFREMEDLRDRLEAAENEALEWEDRAQDGRAHADALQRRNQQLLERCLMLTRSPSTASSVPAVGRGGSALLHLNATPML